VVPRPRPRRFDLAGDPQFLLAVGERVIVALHLGGQEADGILAPGIEQLAGGHRAEPQIFWHHLAAARDELDAVGLADGQELDRDDGSERNPGEQRLVALGVVAETRELHLGRRHVVLREIGLSDHVGRRIGRRYRHGGAHEILRSLELGAREHAVHDRLPMTADDLDVGVARGRDDGGRRPALVALELARQQRAQRNDVVLKIGQLELEALLGRKAAADRHHLKTGVALGFDDAVTPRLSLRVGASGGARESCNDGGRSPHELQSADARHPHPALSLCGFARSIGRRFVAINAAARSRT